MSAPSASHASKRKVNAKLSQRQTAKVFEIGRDGLREYNEMKKRLGSVTLWQFPSGYDHPMIKEVAITTQIDGLLIDKLKSLSLSGDVVHRTQVSVVLGTDTFAPAAGTATTDPVFKKMMIISAVVAAVVRPNGSLLFVEPAPQSEDVRIPIAVIQLKDDKTLLNREMIPIIQYITDEIMACGYGDNNNDIMDSIKNNVFVNGDWKMLQALAGLKGRYCLWCPLVCGQWWCESHYICHEVHAPELNQNEAAPHLVNRYVAEQKVLYYCPDLGLHDPINMTTKLTKMWESCAFLQDAIEIGQSYISYIFDRTAETDNWWFWQPIKIAAQDFLNELNRIEAWRVDNPYYDDDDGLLILDCGTARSNIQNTIGHHGVNVVITDEEVKAYATQKAEETKENETGIHSYIIPVMNLVLKHEKVKKYLFKSHEALKGRWLNVITEIETHFSQPPRTQRLNKMNKDMGVLKKKGAEKFGWTGNISKIVIAGSYCESVLDVVFLTNREDNDLAMLESIFKYTEALVPLYKEFRQVTPELEVRNGESFIIPNCEALNAAVLHARQVFRKEFPSKLENDYPHLQSHAGAIAGQLALHGLLIGTVSSSGVEKIQQVVKRIISREVSSNQSNIDNVLVLQILKRLLERGSLDESDDDDDDDDDDELQSPQASTDEKGKKKRRKKSEMQSLAAATQQRTEMEKKSLREYAMKVKLYYIQQQ